jgi:hypothetical protein
MDDLRSSLAESTGIPASADFATVARAISELPYGRPSTLDAHGVLLSGRGTCSTKHLLLRDVVAECWPELDVVVWHRVYVVTQEFARGRWSDAIALHVPSSGLVDVHTYATIDLNGSNVTVDVTFSIGPWDGCSPLPLACGDGVDHLAGPDPLATKAELVAAHCNAQLREHFIAALSTIT